MAAGDHDCLKWRYLGVVFLVIMLGVGLRVLHDMQRHGQALEEAITHQERQVEQYLADQLESLVARYRLLGAHYGNEPFMPNVLADRDRERLWDYILPDYERIRLHDPELFVMHFLDTDNRTVLRMHQPDRYDDDLTDVRPIVAAVNREGRLHSGFEGGRHGVSYRVTLPLTDRDGLNLGVLEFGIRPSLLVRRLEQRFGLQTMVLVERDQFEKLHDPPTGVEELAGRVVLDLPTDERLLPHFSEFEQGGLVRIDDEVWLAMGAFGLNDYRGEPVVSLMAFKDVTALAAENRAALLRDNAINLAAMVLLLMLVYLMFSRYSAALARSRSAIRHLRDESSSLRDKARKDALTGLFNRRHFDETLPALLADGGQGALLLIDIDHFKAINDRHGHDVGDEVLVLMARQLMQFFRHDDLVVRWGGEEFLVLIPGMNEAAAVGRAEAFRHFVEASSRDQAIAFTVSIGVARIGPDQGQDQAFREADQRLYLAKQRGRNRVVGAG